MQTTIYSSLTTATRKYSRYGTIDSNYYYERYRVIVSQTNSYIFRSNSSMDTYGYFYSSVCLPDYSFRNLIAYDDNSADNGQFQLQMYLQGNFTYELVVTTLNPYTTGSYSITVLGLNPISIVTIAQSSITTSNCRISSRTLFSNRFVREKQRRILFLASTFHTMCSSLSLLVIGQFIRCTDL